VVVHASPASYRSVLRDREFRALFVADGLSVLGDQVARLAVALLVFARTGSPFAASATYACSYLSWLVAGPLLSPLADRLPRRAVMVVCDVVRGLLVAVLLVPGLPLGLVFGVLVVAGLLSPPFEAARSALMADVLHGDRYVVGNALIGTMGQAGQVAGFVAGGALVALLGTRGALLVDAVTFAGSALLYLAMVRDHPTPAPAARSPWRRDLTEGVRLVATRRELRSLLGWGVLVAAVTIPPEGLAVAVARDVGGGSVAAGVLTATVPAGFVVGSWLLLRLPAGRRRRLFPALVLLSSASLALSPGLGAAWQLAAAWTVAGAGMALQTVANSAFVQAVPRELRGRAFGVAATALMAAQGIVLLGAGAVADRVGARPAVALFAAGGAGVVVVLALAARRVRLNPEKVPSDEGRDETR
jgi:MFS family permease